MSRSLRSSQPSNTGSAAHENSTILEIKDERERNSTMRMRADEPTFVEFLARPGEDVITLNESDGHRQRTTEHILHTQNDNVLEFPWPVKPNDRKRRTVHASWTLRRGVASDGRTPVADLEAQDSNGSRVHEY